MPNTFGHLFRITTFGESHGGGVGVVVDGCPPRIPLAGADIQVDLDRRRPGQSKIVTPRKEADACEILSGVTDGQTIGTPIAILVRNEDQRARGLQGNGDALIVRRTPIIRIRRSNGIRAVQGGRAGLGARDDRARGAAARWRSRSSRSCCRIWKF